MTVFITRVTPWSGGDLETHSRGFDPIKTKWEKRNEKHTIALISQ